MALLEIYCMSGVVAKHASMTNRRTKCECSENYESSLGNTYFNVTSPAGGLVQGYDATDPNAKHYVDELTTTVEGALICAN